MEKIKRLSLLMLLLISTSAAADTLRLAGNIWPPYTDQSLPEGGLSVEIIRTALGRAGYRVEYVEVPWARALLGLRNGTYDMLNGWHSATRLAYLRSSRPFLANRMRWIERHDHGLSYHGLDSLLGHAIVLSRGYAYTDELRNDARLSTEYSENFLQAARMVSAGRADLTLEDERTALFHFNRELEDVSAGLRFVPGEFTRLNLSLVVRNSHPQQAAIIAAFNREIEKMVEDGSYAAIFARHGLPVPASLPQP